MKRGRKKYSMTKEGAVTESKGGGGTMMNTIKTFLQNFMDIALVLVGVGVVMQLVFGAGSLYFPVDIVGNIVKLIQMLGGAGLAGMIATAMLCYIICYKR
mgnify:CR=1 FL=1